MDLNYWTIDINDCRSTSKYVLFVDNGVILWNSKCQPTIVLFITEAEYMATAQCTKEAL